MDTPLCTSCKKFFGNPSTENMCSKCFNQAQANKRNLTTVQDIANKVPQITEETKAAPAASPDRCFLCKKRLNLMPFRCECGNYFCTTHRQAEQHNCTFDFKTVGIRKLSEENPLVKAEKLNRL
jgi:hypothetical protein